eukprot:TRINITY_DN5262_c0_g1_i2.p1 TRINITY_DN5262_c0_g1~~TRINITY_DN5262_c0_g1_i2.p1  ORF type:complete len:296 (+),score=43.51 TRINITY_DN5262_c0_g1_i2:740-1627(+)
MPQANNVYVSKLPAGVAENLIWKIFSAYGEINTTKILPAKPYMKTCNALVKYFNEADAKLAIETLNGGIPELLQDQMTEGLECSLARSQEDKDRDNWERKEANAASFQPYNSSKGRTLCKFWQAEGKCKKGSTCPYLHDDGYGGAKKTPKDFRNNERMPAQPPMRPYREAPGPTPAPAIRPTPPVTAGSVIPQPRAAPNREQMNFLRNIPHPLLGTSRNQGEPGSVVTITCIPAWMDEVGILFLFAPYGAINSCEVDGPGAARIHYAHARAASNAVLQLNGFRLGNGALGVTVVS